MRLLFVLALVVALAFLGTQLNAGRPMAEQTVMPQQIQAPLIVGTSFPEPISTVFVLGGAAAILLWYLARRLQLV